MEESTKLNKESWNDYIEYRKEQKMRKLRDKSESRLILWLSNYSHETQADIVDTTIRNGWIGLFPPKDVKHEKKTPRTNEEWEKLGISKGIIARRGETYPQYISRIRTRLDQP